LQGWGSLKINGQSITNPSTQITRGQRIKLLIGANAPFTDDVTIFSFNTGGLANDKTKGTLYKVTCYLNGNVVAQYDFENPTNQVGTTVLDSVSGGSKKNLFNKATASDGKSVGSTGALADNAVATASDFIPVKPNQTYVRNLDVFNTTAWYDVNKTFISRVFTQSSTAPSNAFYARLTVDLAYKETFQFEEGTSPTTFEPFTWQTVSNATNLIPSFDDSRWSLHGNTQVLGKDYIRLNATAVAQRNTFDFPAVVGKTYLFKANDVNQYLIRGIIDSTILVSPISANTYTFTATESIMRIQTTNQTAGTFDFIKPQLFQLDGKEGTLNGSPTRLNKASKRSLTAKR
jgi:hypothetical protein